MCVRTRQKLSRALLSLLAVALAAAWSTPSARAAAYTYSTNQRTINAGILLLDDANSNNLDAGLAGANNPDPYVFYIFNHRGDIKPFGWNIVNPLAPRTVTGNILNRWNARTAGAPPPQYQLGQPITPAMAAYWEVSLSQTSVTNLAQYDVLLLNLQHGSVNFTDDELHKLRHYVDSGGQLWIETAGGSISKPFPAFFDGTFGAGAAGPVTLPPVASILIHHPVISFPYLLSQGELNTLNGSGTINGVAQAITSASGNTPAPDPQLLTSVALEGGGLPLISAGQLGAGQVIITATGSAAAINNAVPGINAGYGPNSGPFCLDNFSLVPTADLKLMADILSWSSAHPNELDTSHQTGASPSSLGPAIAPIWSDNFSAAGTSAPGATVNGNFVYVRGADGILHCFNAAPGTDIIGDGGTDAGIPDFLNGSSYDEVWNTSGTNPSSFQGITPVSLNDPNASAATVASVPVKGSNAATEVFIEKASGEVDQYDATTGANEQLLIKGAGGNAYTGGLAAPSPTYFDGRLYAGQPNGSISVYDFALGAASGPYQVDSNASNQVLAAPTIGLVRTGFNGSYADDIVAAVATASGVYTLQAGSRHDVLNGSPGSPTATAQKANNIPTSGPFTVDAAATPRTAYTDTGGYPNPSPPTTVGVTAPAQFDVTGIPGPPFFADYESDFTISAGTLQSLQRAHFLVGPNGTSAVNLPSSFPTQPGVSAPAMDSNGNLFYTANVAGPTGANGPNSSIVCAHDTKPGGGLSVIKWRFRLPYPGETASLDADGVSDQPLQGFVFVGAPAVDKQGNIFVLAVKYDQVQNKFVGPSAILCFNGSQNVYAQVVNPSIVPPNTVQTGTVEQPVLGLGNNDEFGNPAQQGIPQLSQKQLDQNGNLYISNFGANNVLNDPSALTPDVSEPQPLTVSYNPSTNNGGVPNVVVAPLHTNLTWYTILPPVNPPSSFPATLVGTSGVTLIGNYLRFNAVVPGATGAVCRFYAYPQDAGLVNGGRRVDPTQNDNDGRPLFSYTPTNVGPINSVPSAGSNVVVVNGLNGIAAFGSKYSLVADANRILEIDSDGIATWAVDATSAPGPNGAVTHLEMNHPTSLTQITSNDYLVADTGNNRCVRFDRAGNVVWELSRFNDLTGITYYQNQKSKVSVTKTTPVLSPGDPTTLNHPTSVQSYLQNITDNSGNIINTVVHYLVADTGNNRILEIVDVYDAQGNPVALHDVVWASQTYSQQQRQYRYTNANYFNGPPVNGKVNKYVAALVSNVRLAPLPSPTPNPATGALGPSTGDSPGSTLVLLDYDPTGSNPTEQRNGYISHAVSSFIGYFNGIGVIRTFDLIDAPKQILGTPPTRPPAPAIPQATTVYLRGARFLQAYTPPGALATDSLQNFLLADDNGVYDLYLEQNGPFAGKMVAQWGFTQADYQNLLTTQGIFALIDPSLPLLRDGHGLVPPVPPSTIYTETPNFLTAPIPFAPNSLQRTTTDTVPYNGTNYLIGHYIVTNGYSQGEVTPSSGFGGEVLELGVGVPPSSGPALPLQSLDLSSFSKPGNTGPIAQPAFAAREK